MKKELFPTSTILFDLAKSELSQIAKNELNKAAKTMLQNTDFQLLIEGHTDNTGNQHLNQALSQKRAKACFDYLVLQHIESHRMKYQSYGFERPKTTNKTLTGRSQNRRVELKFFEAK